MNPLLHGGDIVYRHIRIDARAPARRSAFASAAGSPVVRATTNIVPLGILRIRRNKRPCACQYRGHIALTTPTTPAIVMPWRLVALTDALAHCVSMRPEPVRHLLVDQHHWLRFVRVR